MEEEDEQWEELIRSKLYDFEADVNPEDWEAIANKLSGGKVVRFSLYRKLTYTIAAAAVIALLIVGGLVLFTKETVTDPLTQVEKTFQQDTTKEIENTENVTDKVEASVDIFVEKSVNNLLASSVKPVARVIENKAPDAILESPVVTLPVESDKEVTVQSPVEEKPDQKIEDFPAVISKDNPLVASTNQATRRRRWGLGMGGGGYAIGTTTGGLPMTTSSGLLGEDEYMRDIVTLRGGAQGTTFLDPVEGLDNTLLGKVKHKRPISGGLGISYYLTDRWALQSGVVYTLLRSEGSNLDEASNKADWKRYLHFIGVPLSASYTIADWKRIRFYVTAGGMIEWNLAGRQKETIKVKTLETVVISDVKMNELLWSVNTRAGVVYPLWRFIYLYAEGGVAYYFDIHSDIETIRSEKPFNVSIQGGIRLGF